MRRRSVMSMVLLAALIVAASFMVLFTTVG
jgi:hypothetical protein